MSELYETSQFSEEMAASESVPEVVYSGPSIAMQSSMMELIRKEMEQCDGIQGTFINYALGGGTSSTLFSGLSTEMAVNYGKLKNVGF